MNGTGVPDKDVAKWLDARNIISSALIEWGMEPELAEPHAVSIIARLTYHDPPILLTLYEPEKDRAPGSDDPGREEVEKLRDAIRRAGFAVCQTSGDWTLHDVSEYGKEEEARSLEVATRNVELELENIRLRRQIMSLKTWVPHPSTMSGWDNPYCPDEAAALIREACEIYGIDVPKHLIETR